MPIAPDFQTWLKYPNGLPFAIGTKIRISTYSPKRPRCFGYIRAYDALGRAFVEVPHVGQRGDEAIALEHLSLYQG